MEVILKIECKRPELIRKSLLPDLKSGKGLKIDLNSEKGRIIVKIKSKKISYLKAAINSYLSLIKTLKETEELE